MLPTKHKELIEYIQPIEIKLFHGKVESNHMNLFEKFIIKKVDSPIGDYRDWESIASWASNIGRYMQSK